jgi:hypothetical protein
MRLWKVLIGVEILWKYDVLGRFESISIGFVDSE